MSDIFLEWNHLIGLLMTKRLERFQHLRSDTQVHNILNDKMSPINQHFVLITEISSCHNGKIVRLLYLNIQALFKIINDCILISG